MLPKIVKIQHTFIKRLNSFSGTGHLTEQPERGGEDSDCDHKVWDDEYHAICDDGDNVISPSAALEKMNSQF